MGRTLLYVSHPYLHGGGTGAHRTARFARYLTEAGWRVIVLCGPAPAGMPAAQREPFEMIAVPGLLDRQAQGTVGPGPISPASPPHDAPERPTSPSRLRRLLRQVAFIPDPQVFWLGPALAEAGRVLRGAPADVVLCSAPPFSTFLMGWFITMRHGSPLVLDYRDVWLDHPWWPGPRWRRGLERFMQRRLLAAADLIVANHEPMRRQLLAQQPRAAGKCAVIPNGFDPRELGPPVRPVWRPGDRFEIVYAGTLYGPVAGADTGGETLSLQHPSALFRALHDLARRGLFGDGGVRMTFVGAKDGTAEAANVMACARECGVGDQVRVLARMEKREVVPILRDAHLLLNFLYHTEAQVAQKVYDYLHLEIPLLSLFRATEVNAAIVRDAGAGPVVDPGDSRGIAAAIEAIVRWYAAGVTPLPNNRAYIDQFDLVAQGRRLDTMLRRLVDRQPPLGERPDAS